VRIAAPRRSGLVRPEKRRDESRRGSVESPSQVVENTSNRFGGFHTFLVGPPPGPMETDTSVPGPPRRAMIHMKIEAIGLAAKVVADTGDGETVRVLDLGPRTDG
jgi:hypothetical protein